MSMHPRDVERRLRRLGLPLAAKVNVREEGQIMRVTIECSVPLVLVDGMCESALDAECIEALRRFARHDGDD